MSTIMFSSYFHTISIVISILSIIILCTGIYALFVAINLSKLAKTATELYISKNKE